MSTSSLGNRLLAKLHKDGLVELSNGFVCTRGEARLRLTVRATELGADIEQVGRYLRWQEFEALAALALERNQYVSVKNARFKHCGKRREIDVVGCRKPLVICIDCKHWRRGMSPSALRRIVELQVERVKAFADVLPSLSVGFEFTKWNKARFVPVILSLVPVSPKFCEGVPIVPVLQLQDFLYQLPVNLELMRCFSKSFVHL